MPVVATRDLVGRRRWDTRWSVSAPFSRDTQRYLDQRWIELFSRLVPQHALVLEAGCANSHWLPELARWWQCRVMGLDYSLPGCRQASRRLAEAGEAGWIICGDLLAAPLSAAFEGDLVMSFGLVEHFDLPSIAIKALGKLVRPGGYLLTVVPNMAGVVGWGQWLASRRIYHEHLRFTCSSLQVAHEEAGLVVTSCVPFGTWNPWVINLEGLRQPWRRIWQAAINRIAEIGWWYCQRWRLRIENHCWSPYLVCVAQRHEETKEERRASRP